MRVLVFTGMPGSGKSEALSVLRALGVPVYRMGDEIWDEVRARGLPLTPKHVGEVANAMRKEQGEDVWARRTLQRLADNRATAAEAARRAGAGDPREPPLVAIDGTRSLAEVGAFRRALGEQLLVVAVHASIKERHDRLVHRGRADDGASPALAQERDHRELGWGLGEAIALADLHLANHGSLEEFHQRVRTLVEGFLQGGASPSPADAP